MIKTKIFLDFDGTVTFHNENLETQFKNGLAIFLEFLTAHFEVSWCSTIDAGQIQQSIVNYGIDKKIVRKIKDACKFSYISGKSKYLIQEATDFILIDDDPSGRESETLSRNNLMTNLIKADSSNPDDLYRIMDLLRSRFYQGDNIV